MTNKKYELVELNNKSRKGIYIYTKEEGKKGKYIKPKKKRKKRLENQLKKGIRSVKITTLNKETLHRAKRRLLRNIIKDKEITEIIITEHNLQKIKHRFEIELTGKGENGKIFTAGKLNTTPDQALRESEKVKIGDYIKTEINYTIGPKLKELEQKGWTIEQYRSGKITGITMSITFRKQ